MPDLNAADLTPAKEALRDGLHIVLLASKHDIDGALSSLMVSDDFGMNYHMQRVFKAMRLVHTKIKELKQEVKSEK